MSTYPSLVLSTQCVYLPWSFLGSIPKTSMVTTTNTANQIWSFMSVCYSSPACRYLCYLQDQQNWIIKDRLLIWSLKATFFRFWSLEWQLFHLAQRKSLKNNSGPLFHILLKDDNCLVIVIKDHIFHIALLSVRQSAKHHSRLLCVYSLAKLASVDYITAPPSKIFSLFCELMLYGYVAIIPTSNMYFFVSSMRWFAAKLRPLALYRLHCVRWILHTMISLIWQVSIWLQIRVHRPCLISFGVWRSEAILYILSRIDSVWLSE